MPIYCYKCPICGDTTEVLREVKDVDAVVFCSCRELFVQMERDYSSQNVKVFGDIVPYFDYSIGQQITGRRDKITKYRAGGYIQQEAMHGSESVAPEKRLYGDEQYQDEVISGGKETDFQKFVDEKVSEGLERSDLEGASGDGFSKSIA